MIVALHVPGMRVVLIGQNAVVSAGFKWLAPIVSHSRQQLASTVSLLRFRIFHDSFSHRITRRCSAAATNCRQCSVSSLLFFSVAPKVVLRQVVRQSYGYWQ